jgi:hypothetical protein
MQKITASPDTRRPAPPPPPRAEPATPVVATELPDTALRALFAKFEMPWEGESSRSVLLRALTCLETIEELKTRAAQGPRIPPPLPLANA